MTTSLSIGQRIPLTQLGVASSFDLTLTAYGEAKEYDAACFVLDSNGKLLNDHWMVFYNQPSSPDHAISWGRSGPASLFSLELARLGPQVERLAFTLSPDLTGGGEMRGVSSGELRVGGATWAFTGADFGAEKAIIAAEIYRYKGEWRLMINGQGFVSGLSGLVEHFGGEVAASNTPPVSAPSAAPVPPPPAPRAPAPPPSVSLTKVTLEKAGEKARISLQKAGSQPFHVNLNWNSQARSVGGLFGRRSRAQADLDLGCMYELHSGEKGVVQALGGRMGVRGQPPYIYLDQDDRTGANAGGENLYLERPDLLRRALIFAFIYEGVAQFDAVEGRLSFTDPQGNDVRLNLSNPTTLPFCAVAMLETNGQELTITKEECYFADHQECDAAYGFGFRWQAGRK